MRKFLSLLLAAVLICSTVLFPASAEVMNEQDLAVAAIENEIQSLQPRAVGDQTTYHICQEVDGQVLMNGGGNMLFKGNFNASSTSQQWLFEEFGDYSAYFGVYYIRYAGNPSYVLGAKQSTGEVALVPFTTTDYCIYWVIYTTSNGTYICPDYNLNSSGDGYLCMSTSYPYTFSISSSPTENCKMLLISPSVTQVTFIAAGNMRIPIGDSTSISDISVFPGGTEYSSLEWLSYMSSNTSVCTVNAGGLITAISEGTATITVRHKIFGTTTTFSVIVDDPIIVTVYILYDDYTSELYTPTEMENILSGVASAIYYNFGVSFVTKKTELGDSTARYEAALDHSCLNTARSELCTAACGVLSACETQHHKSDDVILNIETDDDKNILRFVGYKMCDYDDEDNSHKFVGGVADGRVIEISSVPEDPPANVVVSTYHESMIRKYLQHELCHTIGASDNVCSDSSCVMNYASGQTTDQWCDNCRYIINLYLSVYLGG